MRTTMLQPQPAPGRASPGDPGSAPAAPARPAQPAPGTEAPTEGNGAPPEESPGAFGGMALVLPFLLLFGLLFLMNRGEKKKRSALESKLKRGDRVLTRSGIKGKLIEVTDATVKVEIAPGVTVTMVKQSIDGIDTTDPSSSTGKGSGKDGKADKDRKGSKNRGDKDRKGAKDTQDDDDSDGGKSGKEEKKKKWGIFSSALAQRATAGP